MDKIDLADVSDADKLALFAAQESVRIGNAELAESAIELHARAQECAAATLHGATADFNMEEAVRAMKIKYDAVIANNTKMLDGVRRYRMSIDAEVSHLEASLSRLSSKIKQVDELTAALNKLRDAAANPILQGILK